VERLLLDEDAHGVGDRLAWGRFADQAIGSPETVRRQLAALLDRTGADELMLTAMVYDIADRIRSFELIAEKVADGLNSPP
jgi:alkanesulfonate monooxygenase SsuD/methylene tetrahydromethanopterin reductase-like flavin-dependent oxidoreductase (luciferase family)